MPLIGASRASRLFREMLVLARRLPEKSRADAVRRIVVGFREGRGVSDEAAYVLACRRAARASRQLRADAMRHLARGRVVPCARRIAERMGAAEKRLRVLRMSTPRVAGNTADSPASGQRGGRTTYVVRDGKLVEGHGTLTPGKAVHSNWGAGNVDPDDLARHHQQMRRFRFQDRPGGAPTAPVWD